MPTIHVQAKSSAPVRYVAAAVGCLLLAAAAQPLPLAVSARPHQAVGRIEGSVVLSSALTNRRPRFRIYVDPGPGALPPRPDTGSEMRNVVIYVQSDAARPFPVASFALAPRRMVQREEQFVPHVLPVVKGTRVEFPNDDDVYHNVFSLSSAATFDLGRYPQGASKSVTFSNTGTVQVFCHIHSDMSGVVLVLDNPYFATPTPAGRYVIENVPVGDYAVVGWHERAKPIVMRLHVTEGQTASLDFNIPILPPSRP